MTPRQLAEQCATCTQIDRSRWSVWLTLEPLGVQKANCWIQDYAEEYLAQGRREAVAHAVEALLTEGAKLYRDGKITLEETPKGTPWCPVCKMRCYVWENTTRCCGAVPEYRQEEPHEQP